MRLDPYNIIARTVSPHGPGGCDSPFAIGPLPDAGATS